MTRLTRTLVGLLCLEFILGMLANLYAEIPSDDPGSVFRHVGYISIHSLNAVLILVISGLVLRTAIMQKDRVANAAWGLTGIVIAFIAGHLFVGTQNEIYSLVMALGFIVSFGSYMYRLSTK